MNKLIKIVLPLLVLLLSTRSVGESEPSASLSEPLVGSVYQVRESFVIQLPQAYTEKPVSLEVNNIDVSALVTRNGRQLTFKPLSPLEVGKTILRVVHFAEDGSVAELGYWEVEVGQSARFQEASLHGGLDISFNQRVAESDDQQTRAASSSQALGHYNAVVATQHWRSEASANVMYADDPLQTLTGERADIPNFHLKNTVGNFSLSLGDHVVATPDLLHDGYQKRGVSSSLKLPSAKSAVDVLSVASNQRVGLEGGLGLSDENNRMVGARVRFQPIKNPLAHIVISTSFLSGKSEQTSFGSVQIQNPYPTAVNKGEAWNTVIDSQFFDQVLRLRYEYANSRFDFDGIDNGEDAHEDAAWSSLVLFNIPAKNHGQTSLNLGFEKKKIGTLYKSIANMHLPADKDYQKMFMMGSRDKWSWNAAFATESNNLDDHSQFAKTETRHLSLAGSYQEYEQAKPGSVLAFLGTPSLNLQANSSEIEDLYTPAGYIENDLSTRSAGINTLFAHPTWNWSFAINQDELEDHSGWQAQTQTRAFVFNTSMQLGKKYHLGVGWQLQKTWYPEDDVDTNRQYYSLEARANFIPDRLFATLSYGVNQNNASDDPYYALRDQSTFVSGELAWAVKEPKNKRVGVSISLAFQYNEFEDYLSILNNTDGNQVFLKIHTILPTALPGAQ